MGKDLKGKELGRGLSQRPDGRYMARAQVEGQPIVLYGWKLKELKKELALAVDEAKRSNLLPGMDGKSITLSEWFEEWYAKYKAPTLKGGGSASYKRKFLNYYGVRIGSKFLSDIRQLHVQTAIADMLEAGRTSKSVREATGILQNCVEAAIANGLMSINPVVGVIVPKCEKVERRVLSVEEQEIFLDYLARTKSWYAMKLTSPKTENSVRKIPFFGETREILESQFEKVKRKRVDLGERWRQPEELGNLVFLTSMGSPIGRYSVESDMRYVTKQMNDMFHTEALYTGGIPKKFERVHPHALRHTFVTRCFEKGMTPRTVQEIMGHANYNTTVSYTHVLDDIKLKEAERLGDFLQNKNNDETIEYSGLLGIM